MRKGWKKTEFRSECCLAEEEEEGRPRVMWLDQGSQTRGPPVHFVALALIVFELQHAARPTSDLSLTT
jgi:hypothetical protein